MCAFKQRAFYDGVSDGDCRRVNELLAEGADVNADGGRALYDACRLGDAPMTRLLLDAGARCGNDLQRAANALVEASAAGNKAIAELLIERCEGITVQTIDDALAQAAGDGRLEMVDYLLTKGGDPRSGDSRALRTAVVAGRTAAAQRLLDAGADPTVLNYAPSLTAASHQDFAMVEILFEHGGTPDIPELRKYLAQVDPESRALAAFDAWYSLQLQVAVAEAVAGAESDWVERTDSMQSEDLGL